MGPLRVLVSGAFDLLHSGHVAFLTRARAAAGVGGQVLVRVLSDADPRLEQAPVIPLKERLFLVQNLRLTSAAGASAGSLVADLDAVRPDAVFCNAGELKAGELAACQARGVIVIEGARTPLLGLTPRSTQSVKKQLSQQKARAAAAAASAAAAAGGDARPLAQPAVAPAAPGGAPSASTSAAVPSLDPSLVEPARAELAAPRPSGARPVVFVSGCYDLLHSGHVAFFSEAAEMGDLYVSIGSDANIVMLKHHEPMFPELERRAMVQAVRSVREARICRGQGMLDFEADLDIIKPDVFFVNEDGHRESKAAACAARGIRYVVGKRAPSAGLEARSSTALKSELEKIADEVEDLHAFPWRICLAGGWLDQPWVSQVHAGCVVVVNVMPHEQFKTRSGLATSSRQVGMRLWGTRSRQAQGPPRDVPPIELAKLLFGAENPPGSRHISGSQDHLGLMLPGVNRLDYAGEYWPHSVVPCNDLDTCRWLEGVLWLVPLPSRPEGYDPLLTKNISHDRVKLLADASASAWQAIQAKDARALGKALSDTMLAWREMLPNTVPQPSSDQWCAPYRQDPNVHGCLFSGCGGGYLMVISEKPVLRGFQIKIKTSPWITP
jgi:cytidyltransferase-like protein